MEVVPTVEEAELESPDVDPEALEKGAIPVRNFYYLLCYAWNYLELGRPIPMPSGRCPNLANLFALVLARGIQHEIRRGIHREYIEEKEETPRIRGRLVIQDSMQRQSWNHGRMVCQFDELSHDVLPNQILLATGQRLLRDPKVTSKNRAALRDQLDWFHDVSPLALSSRHFRQVQVHRRSRTYRFLLSMCELLHRHHLPGEGDGGSNDLLLRRILDDEISLCHLFETFVRNFYDKHLPDCRVAGSQITWDGDGLDTVSKAHLPALLTDVTIDGPDTRIILDCKFYKNALKGGQRDDKVTGAHLYQLLAYLQNALRTFANWSEGQRPRGILLYPVVKQSFDFHYELLGFSIRVCTVNLNQPWEEIEDALIRVSDACNG
ncbi:MAG: hypothetical protein P1U58_20565 [Verrucomicrobiales bacterium]|nr:hypothetical protein [Verrucomicrobiales bacterium]